MVPYRHCVLVTTVCDDDVEWIYLSHIWLKGKTKKHIYMMFDLLTTALNWPAKIIAGNWQFSKKQMNLI